MQLRAQIDINGINPYVLVSSDLASKLKPNWRRPMPVLIKVNGVPENYWRINMMPKGDGDFYLYLHNDVRKESSTKVGDIVDVEIQFDSSYKNGPQHETFKQLDILLLNNPTANKNWQSLPPSRKKEVLRYFANLKSQEAVERNYLRLADALSGKTTRFMARDWIHGK
jgi:hypothetical protein